MLRFSVRHTVAQKLSQRNRKKKQVWRFKYQMQVKSLEKPNKLLFEKKILWFLKKTTIFADNTFFFY